MKFKFTPERVAEAVSIPEYLSVLSGNLAVVLSILPRMAVDEQGEYIVVVVYDEDGDIKEYQNLESALIAMNKMPPRKLNDIAIQIVKACKEIVNPPKGDGSKTPSPTEPPPPPAG